MRQITGFWNVSSCVLLYCILNRFSVRDLHIREYANDFSMVPTGDFCFLFCAIAHFLWKWRLLPLRAAIALTRNQAGVN